MRKDQIGRMRDDVRALQGQRARGLRIEPVEADHDADARMADVEHRKACLSGSEPDRLFEKQMCLPVSADHLRRPDQHRRVVETVPLPFREACHEMHSPSRGKLTEPGRGRARDLLRQLARLIDRHELIAGVEQLRENQEIAGESGQPLADLVQVARDFSKDRVELKISDFHHAL